MEPTRVGLEAATQFVTWGPPAALAAASLLIAFSLSRSWPPVDSTQHWTERARNAFPVIQAVSGFAVVWQWLALIIFVGTSFGSKFDRWWLVALAIACSRLTFQVMTYLVISRLPGVREARRASPFPTLFWGAIEAALASSIIVLTGAARGVACLAAVAILFAGARGLLARGLAGRLFGFESMPLALEQRLRESLPDRARGLHLSVLVSPVVQAMMIGRTMVFTSRAVAELSTQQLVAIAAHEFGHSVHRPLLARSMRLFVAGAPWLAFAALGLLPSGASAAVLAILGLVVVKVSASEQLRSEEDHADDAADAEHLASALERTAELNLTPAVMSLKTTHRDLIERLARLGRKPSWPVPPPPEVKPTPLTTIPLLVVCFAVAYALSVNTSNATVASLRLAHGEARGIDDQNEPVYRALAALDCRAARLSMPSAATPALKAIVTDCEQLARTECDLLFETEVEELAEHLRIGAAGAEGVVVDYDELHILGKGLIPPPGRVEQNGLRRITLATESPTTPGPVNELGIGWRDQSRAGLIPWASIFAVQTRYRCWSRN